MCFTRHISLSSGMSSPSGVVWVCTSEGTQRRMFPSSPAEASISPITTQHDFRFFNRVQTFGTESNDIDSLRMLDQGCEVCSFSFFAVCFNLPQLSIVR